MAFDPVTANLIQNGSNIPHQLRQVVSDNQELFGKDTLKIVLGDGKVDVPGTMRWLEAKKSPTAAESTVLSALKEATTQKRLYNNQGLDVEALEDKITAAPATAPAPAPAPSVVPTTNTTTAGGKPAPAAVTKAPPALSAGERLNQVADYPPTGKRDYLRAGQDDAARADMKGLVDRALTRQNQTAPSNYEEAVAAYQRARGLTGSEIDGKIGSQTMDLLRTDENLTAQDKTMNKTSQQLFGQTPKWKEAEATQGTKQPDAVEQKTTSEATGECVPETKQAELKIPAYDESATAAVAKVNEGTESTPTSALSKARTRAERLKDDALFLQIDRSDNTATGKKLGSAMVDEGSAGNAHNPNTREVRELLEKQLPKISGAEKEEASELVSALRGIENEGFKYSREEQLGLVNRAVRFGNEIERKYLGTEAGKTASVDAPTVEGAAADFRRASQLLEWVGTGEAKWKVAGGPHGDMVGWNGFSHDGVNYTIALNRNGALAFQAGDWKYTSEPGQAGYDNLATRSVQIMQAYGALGLQPENLLITR